MPFFTRIRHNLPPMDHVRLLTTADGEVELSMIRGLLEDAGIPFYLRDRDSSSTLRICAGYTVFGTDVFVDEDDFDRAAELVTAYASAEGVVEDESLDEESRRELEESMAKDGSEDRPTIEEMQSGTDRAIGTVSGILWGAGLVLAMVVLIALVLWNSFV